MYVETSLQYEFIASLSSKRNHRWKSFASSTPHYFRVTCTFVWSVVNQGLLSGCNLVAVCQWRLILIFTIELPYAPAETEAEKCDVNQMLSSYRKYWRKALFNWPSFSSDIIGQGAFILSDSIFYSIVLSLKSQ